MHGVAEAMELNHESEMQRHHAIIHGLQKVTTANRLCRFAQNDSKLEFSGRLSKIWDAQSLMLCSPGGHAQTRTSQLSIGERRCWSGR
jgi:hypothetical protein